MIDIKLIRENKELVKENIKKKFQDQKLPLVDEVFELDQKTRALKLEGDNLRKERKDKSEEIGSLMRDKQIDKANTIKEEVTKINTRIQELEEEENKTNTRIKEIMMTIPNIMDPSVPLGEDDSKNVELEKYGDPKVPDYEIPYHADILGSISGLDKDSAGRVTGAGFYYLMGDAARLVTAMISYGRDYMLEKGFTYCIPPFMLREEAIDEVMSFEERDAMVYKVEGEDLFLVGTSEHPMIAKYMGQILRKEELPITMTSYSPCFRKEVGAHGIEERGIYGVHQFEKQEMIVLCEPKDSMDWYNKMWKYTVDIFNNMNIPVRTLECCSGDLADLKVKSVDIEAWSPRQKTYYEVGSCSTLGDAQARRLGIRVKGENGNYHPHTLNNTVLASTRALIALIENNYNADGSITIPKVLRPYMGNKEKIEKAK